MKAQISTLKREIEIHKEVEKELAKRSHFCQKVIRRLKTENNELKENQVPRPKTYMPGRNNDFASKTMSNMKGLSGMGAGQSEAHKQAMQDELKSSEELITFLEGKLEQHEKHLGQKHTEYEHLQHEYFDLQDKFNANRQKYKRAALILTDYLEDLLNQ